MDSGLHDKEKVRQKVKNKADKKVKDPVEMSCRMLLVRRTKTKRKSIYASILLIQTQLVPNIFIRLVLYSANRGKQRKTNYVKL